VRDPQRRARLLAAGIALPDAFGTVVEELLDRSPEAATFPELERLLSQRLALKEARILNPPPWATWTDFTSDVLDQITIGTYDGNAPILSQINELYYLGPGFTPGQPYNAIPGTDVALFTPYRKEQRNLRDRSARDLMTVKGVVADTERRLRSISAYTGGTEQDAALRDITDRMLDVFSRETTRIVQVLQGGKAEPRKAQRKGTVRSPGSVPAFIRSLLAANPGRWYSNKELGELWLKLHPEDDGNDFGSVRRTTKNDHAAGLLERDGTSTVGLRYRVPPVP
jgi:hypothetical protein